jgi:hypothetical protein
MRGCTPEHLEQLRDVQAVLAAADAERTWAFGQGASTRRCQILRRGSLF